MRKSRYVVEAEGPRGELLLFNTTNGAFVQLGSAGRALWESAGGDLAADDPTTDAAAIADAPSPDIPRGLIAGDSDTNADNPASAADDSAAVYDTRNSAHTPGADYPSLVPAANATAFAAGNPIADSPIAEARETLEMLGFLTSLTAEEELQLQREAFDRQRADTTSMTLSFVPTYVCNFRCPYCYELGHNKTPGKMDARMMDAITDFVRTRHEAEGFQTLNVQWYGGDPSLALDVVKALTERLIRFCDERNISYEAMMLTNANVIDEEEAQLIADRRVFSVFLTIDGPEEIHNKRRVAANGSNSYERTIHAARLFRERGIALRANMNADKLTLPLYADLRKKLLAEEGIELSFGKLNDYGHFFGQAPFCKPEFDLYDHEEFFRAQFQEFAKLSHTADEMREMLRPPKRFCTGQANNYFVIDLLGDVYKCDGWVGEKDRVRFNLLDDPSTWKLDEVSFDPTRDARCSACNLMPLCLGSCIWERELSGMPCHPFKTTIGDYLRIYRECLDAEAEPGTATSSNGADEAPVTVLAV